MARPNWSRPLPRALSIVDDGKEFLRLTTAHADGARDFLNLAFRRNGCSSTRGRPSHQRLDTASAGRSIDDLPTALQMLLMLEGVEVPAEVTSSSGL